MNAVIALCHFCEAHGPCAIFCTQTLRDTKIEDLQLDQQYLPNKLCSGCNSLSKKNFIYTRDEESQAIFLSSQMPILDEVADLIKQASVRSLSCEINCSKDGGFVFFGDSIRGHVLSHTFHVSDLQARGFFQLFSIIILMKDKYFLLNIKPFFAEHLKKISTEIQNSARRLKNGEETKGFIKQRRLSSSQLLVQTPLSLVELTGEANIYAILHSHFSWILLAGARFLTEQVAFGNLPWLSGNNVSKIHNQTKGGSELSASELVKKYENESENESLFSLRDAKQLLGNQFSAVCYCVLVGIKVVIRAPQYNNLNLLMCLRKLLPEKMHHLICLDSVHFSATSDFRVIAIPPSDILPAANNSLFCIDFVNKEHFSATWAGDIPSKWPDLLARLLKAVDEPRFGNLVLNKHTKVLIEEWKNKIICVYGAKSNKGLNKLKTVLGIQPHDQVLINYWANYLR